LDFDIVLEKQKEGGYTVYVPALPGCISEGETRAEAVRNIKEAISLYLEETRKTKLKQLLKSVSIMKATVKAYA
jgi:predicted RNase H-like HicB family nuclease